MVATCTYRTSRAMATCMRIPGEQICTQHVKIHSLQLLTGLKVNSSVVTHGLYVRETGVRHGRLEPCSLQQRHSISSATIAFVISLAATTLSFVGAAQRLRKGTGVFNQEVRPRLSSNEKCCRTERWERSCQDRSCTAPYRYT